MVLLDKDISYRAEFHILPSDCGHVLGLGVCPINPNLELNLVKDEDENNNK
jgi:hypothetical protein